MKIFDKTTADNFTSETTLCFGYVVRFQVWDNPKESMLGITLRQHAIYICACICWRLGLMYRLSRREKFIYSSIQGGSVLTDNWVTNWRTTPYYANFVTLGVPRFQTTLLWHKSSVTSNRSSTIFSWNAYRLMKYKKETLSEGGAKGFNKSPKN